MLFVADMHMERLQRFCCESILLQGGCHILQRAMLIHVDKVHMQVEMRITIVLMFNCSSKGISTTTKTSAREHVAAKHVLTRIAMEVSIYAVMMVTVWAERAHSHPENQWQHAQYPNAKSLDPA